MVEVTGRAVPVSGLSSGLEKILDNTIPVVTSDVSRPGGCFLLCFKVAKQY